MMSVFSISHDLSFGDVLARGVLARWGDDPLQLGAVRILLPTRRACRALEQAFLRVSEGKSLILPALIPLGDLEDEEGLNSFEGCEEALPPPLSSLRRQLLLAQLVHRWAQVRGDTLPDDQALHLAGELGRLLDQVETEGLCLSRLADLVPDDYAEHWQVTLEFLNVLTEHWPAIQRATGAMGPKERRRRVLETQARRWQETPPSAPVVIAGSTGSIPAVAELMSVVAAAPQGQVVLPGLDFGASPEVWAAISDNPTHPQYGLARVLAHLGLSREEVGRWDSTTKGETESGQEGTRSARAALIHMALRPAQATGDWPAFIADKSADFFDAALRDVVRIDCQTPPQESAVIALLLRSVLEKPGKTAALITPDQKLARRVKADLARWGVEIDSSAGSPLLESRSAVFLRLCAEVVAADFAPVPLLALLKHPLAACGLASGQLRQVVRALERRALRGPRPAGGLAGLCAAVQDNKDCYALLTAFSDAVAPFVAALGEGSGQLVDILSAHIRFAEQLAGTADQEGAERLWAGDSGASLADFVSELLDCADVAPSFDPKSYPDVFATVMVGCVVRPPYGTHPRAMILGTMEARMQQADVVIMGSLNEGTWPGEPDPGPWMSRPMRQDFGLRPPEERIGLAAQDFLQGFCAPKLYMTRSGKVAGTPTRPSRWLLRLESLLAGCGRQICDGTARWCGLADQLDQPDGPPCPVPPPAPRPPVAVRPRDLSVTRIETWMRDPYALYAQKILKLKKLSPLDEDPTVAQKGQFIHAALEQFIAEGAMTGPNPLARLLELGQVAFAPLRAHPHLWAFWWARFERIARWVVDQERGRMGRLCASEVEVTGCLTLPCGFTLRAQADRIDLRTDGGAEILDYKTGAPPTTLEVQSGLSPQLPLEAAILQDGCFATRDGRALPTQKVTGLYYWKLSGGEPAGEIKVIGSKKMPVDDIVAGTLTRVEDMIAAFDDPQMPYRARPAGVRPLKYNDYEHLARVREWSVSASEDDSDDG